MYVCYIYVVCVDCVIGLVVCVIVNIYMDISVYYYLCELEM